MYITLYSSHCPRCLIIERLLTEYDLVFDVCDDEKIYLPIADQCGITHMPFATVYAGADDVEGRVLTCNELRAVIAELSI